MTTPTRIGTVNRSGIWFTLYQAPGKPGDALPLYFGIVRGEHDQPPYCDQPSVASVFRSLGWSARTPWVRAERCMDCRAVGALHCSDPANCGGMRPVYQGA